MITDDSSCINSLPLLVLERYSPQWREGRRGSYKEKSYEWVQRVRNKKEKTRCIDSALPRNRNGTRRTVKHVPLLGKTLCLLLLRFYYFVSFFLPLLPPFLPPPYSGKFLRGGKEGSFYLEPAPLADTNYADEKFTTFHRPSPFSHRPSDLNQTNHCPTSNKRVLHYFHGPLPYFPQDVEGPLSSPFSPSFFSLSFFFSFPFTLAVSFASRIAPQAIHVWEGIFRKSSFHFHVVICALENSNGNSVSRESTRELLKKKKIINARRNEPTSVDTVVYAVNLIFCPRYLSCNNSLSN